MVTWLKCWILRQIRPRGDLPAAKWYNCGGKRGIRGAFRTDPPRLPGLEISAMTFSTKCAAKLVVCLAVWNLAARPASAQHHSNHHGSGHHGSSHHSGHGSSHHSGHYGYSPHSSHRSSHHGGYHSSWGHVVPSHHDHVGLYYSYGGATITLLTRLNLEPRSTAHRFNLDGHTLRAPCAKPSPSFPAP